MTINKISVNFSGINTIQQNYQKQQNRTMQTPTSEVSNTTQVQTVTLQGYIAPYKINPAIYVIDKDGNYTKYPSQVVASKELGITTGCISRCINSDAGKTNGYVIVSALDVEKLDENGNTIVNSTKIQDISKKLHPDNAVYVIEEDGSFKRYSSPEETAEMTGIEEVTLTKGFNGFKKVIGKQTFVKAKNLETKKIDGKFVLDEDKIITLYIGNRHAFYAIDKKGNATLFKSHAEAYGKLGSSFSSITSCLNGKIKNTDGYTFAKPTQVLGVNDQNKIVVNKEKVKTLLKERF